MRLAREAPCPAAHLTERRWPMIASSTQAPNHPIGPRFYRNVATAPWSRTSDGIVPPAVARSHRSQHSEISANADDSGIADSMVPSPCSGRRNEPLPLRCPPQSEESKLGYCSPRAGMPPSSTPPIVERASASSVPWRRPARQYAFPDQHDVGFLESGGGASMTGHHSRYMVRLLRPFPSAAQPRRCVCCTQVPGKQGARSCSRSIGGRR